MTDKPPETGLGDGPEGDANAVARETLAQRVAASLRDMIVQDILPPGSRVRERTLAQELDVSRTPMREALRILATEQTGTSIERVAYREALHKLSGKDHGDDVKAWRRWWRETAEEPSGRESRLGG